MKGKPARDNPGNASCPCGSGQRYADCCGPLHAGGQNAADAESLMRSRYSAFVLKDRAYLLATWHPEHRPDDLDLSADDTHWLGLEVRKHTPLDAQNATVEFVARYRIAGRGHRLHELSRFIKVDGRWVYIDGEVLP